MTKSKISETLLQRLGMRERWRYDISRIRCNLLRSVSYRNECERRRLRAEVNNEVQIKTVERETYHCQCSTPDPLQGAAALLKDATLSFRSHTQRNIFLCASRKNVLCYRIS